MEQVPNVIAFGLMYYNARWYDPTIARFAQADSIVPEGVQGYDRYAYANNSPVRYKDPSGHAADSGGASGGCSYLDSCNLGRSTPGGEAGSDDNTSLNHSDAQYLSLSISAGIGPLYGAWSFDMVGTEDECGFFSVYSVGPGVDNRIETLPSTVSLRQMDNTWMTPQIGATLYRGWVWGTPLRERVAYYEGTTKIAGGSVGSPVALAGEYFESADRYSGKPNGQVHGVGVGAGVGLVPAEGHLIYGEAVYHRDLSALVTGIYTNVGLFPRP